MYTIDEKTGLVRAWFDPSIQAQREQYKLLTSIYFLIKQGDVFGERLKCVKCGGRHNYITLNCIERPFTGLTKGLYAYYQAVKDHGIAEHLNEAEVSRYRSMERSLNQMPDIGLSHPEMAKQITKELGPSDALIGALALGILEGISSIMAHKLVQKINDRGLKPKLILEKPSTFDKLLRQRQKQMKVG